MVGEGLFTNIKIWTCFLGYANEVGEAFRSQVHVNWVRASYGVASLYVCADAADKGKQANQVNDIQFIMFYNELNILHILTAE